MVFTPPGVQGDENIWKRETPNDQTFGYLSMKHAVKIALRIL